MELIKEKIPESIKKRMSDEERLLSREKTSFLKETEATEQWRLRQLQLPQESPPLGGRESREFGLAVREEEYEFVDPRPQEMQTIAMEDLSGVSIDWHMLTTLRPTKKMDENFFSQSETEFCDETCQVLFQIGEPVPADHQDQEAREEDPAGERRTGPGLHVQTPE